MGSLLLPLAPALALAAAAAAAVVEVVGKVAVVALGHEVPSVSCLGWLGQHTCPRLFVVLRWMVGRWNWNRWWLAVGLVMERLQ